MGETLRDFSRRVYGGHVVTAPPKVDYFAIGTRVRRIVDGAVGTVTDRQWNVGTMILVVRLDDGGDGAWSVTGRISAWELVDQETPSLDELLADDRMVAYQIEQASRELGALPPVEQHKADLEIIVAYCETSAPFGNVKKLAQALLDRIPAEEPECQHPLQRETKRTCDYWAMTVEVELACPDCGSEWSEQL